MLVRIAVVWLVVLTLSIPALPQGGSCTPTTGWELSGYAGNTDTGPGNDPNWQTQLQNLEDQYGGLPTCNYTFILDNPDTGYGHYSGDCTVRAYICTGGQPPPVVDGGSEGSSGSSCPAKTPTPACGRPIKLINGDTYIEQRDILLPGIGGGLSLTRTWNSVKPQMQTQMAVGLFGNNWTSTYEERVYPNQTGPLVLTWASAVTYANASGEFWTFQYWGPIQGTIVFQVISPADLHATLRNTSQVWKLTFANGEKRIFDFKTGLLTAIIDRNGNTTQIAHDTLNRLTTVTDAAGRHLYFNYGSPIGNLVTSVTSDVGVTWTYSYDSQNRLSQVTKPDQTTINFTYNAASQISAVTDSQGKVIESHTYDNAGRGLTSSQANGVEAVTVSYPQ